MKIWQVVCFQFYMAILNILIQVPQLSPYPGACSVVVMDNCAIHHDEEVRAIIEGECGMSEYCLKHKPQLKLVLLGAKLIYLPPYSPDFNPIEQAFHSMKAWLRQHEVEAINPQVRPWLIHQATMSITTHDVEGWIINLGYSFDV